jgi:hypothetical protein
VAAATVVLLLVTLRAKPYYAGPLFPTMFAAGAVAWEAHRTRAGRHGAPRAGIALLAVSTLLALPLTVPLLPRPLLVDSGLYRAREDFAEMFGWPELAATVTGVYHGLPPAQRPQATVVTGNYGQAAALDRFAPGLPAASGHNSYWLWRPHEAPLGVIVAVGLPERLLRRLFGRVELVAVVANADGVENEEFGARVHVARGPRLAPEAIWRALRHFN